MNENDRDHKKFEAPKPVTKDRILELSIYAENGHDEGIAQIDNFVVFVKGARTGERCKVKITDVKRTYAIAQRV